MSRAHVLAIVNAVATVTFAIAATVRWRHSAFEPELPHGVVDSATNIIFATDSARDADVDRVVSNDPFRLSKSPSRVAYDGDAASTESNVYAPRPPRPNLVLKAIVGGPPWRAIIDGLPGQGTGAIATQGAVFDRLLIKSVARDRVVVQAPDTSWVLTFGGAP